MAGVAVFELVDTSKRQVSVVITYRPQRLQRDCIVEKQLSFFPASGAHGRVGALAHFETVPQEPSAADEE